MKKFLFLLMILPAFGFAQGGKRTSQPQLFEFSTSFQKSETRNVQKYLDRKLGGQRTFAGTEMDATVTLDNGMTFYIKLKPGSLKLVFDRSRNSPEHYTRMKEACEGIKSRVG